MSAAEQLEDSGKAPPPRDALIEEGAFIEATLTEPPARTGAKLRPLLALAPYVARYRGRALFEELAGHSHWLIGESGADKIAQRAVAWLGQVLTKVGARQET